MSLTDLVVNTGVEQDALSNGGLAGIDVSHDADVADLLKVGQHFECHRWCHSVVFKKVTTAAATNTSFTRLATAVGMAVLPAVVSEGLVGLGHLVDVFATLNSGA